MSDHGQDVVEEVVEDAEVAALRTKLALLQQIQQLQNATGLGPTVPQQVQVQTAMPTPKNVKPPEGRYNMSLLEFRTYAKDCMDYKTLTRYTDEQIVLQMRLNMDSDLKLAVDTNYPEWRASTVEDAIKTVGEIVNQISNCAVYRKAFNNMVQSEDEKIREFSTRLRSCAADCLFLCPYDDTHDLTDYDIIELVRAGVQDKQLQQELLQKHSTLNTVQNIIQYCEDFEWAKRDKDVLMYHKHDTVGAVALSSAEYHTSQDEIVAALSVYRESKHKDHSIHPELGASKDEIIAALFTYRKMKKSKDKDGCGSCGYHHAQGKCSAIGKLCLKCGKANHLSRLCRAGGQ